MLNPYNKLSVLLLLFINLIIFIYSNLCNIIIFLIILLNTKFLLKDFKNKHKNYSFIHRFKSIKNNIINVIFTRLIAAPFVLTFMFLISSLPEVSTFDIVTVAYITQLPLCYINHISRQLYIKFITMNSFNVATSKNRIKIIYHRFSLDITLSSNSVIEKVNLYNLVLRIAILCITGLVPIIYIIFVISVVFIIYLSSYNLKKPCVKSGFTPLHSVIPMTTSSTLGLGTAILFSINNCEQVNVNPEKVLSIVDHNPYSQQTLFRNEVGANTNISPQDKNLIEKSSILKLLQAINVDKTHFYDEALEKQFISTNRKDETVVAYKKFNSQTTSVLIHRLDIESTSYYPTYYTNEESVLKLHKFLEHKYLIPQDKVKNLVVFTQKQFLGDSLYSV